jgi:hypothetical protein
LALDSGGKNNEQLATGHVILLAAANNLLVERCKKKRLKTIACPKNA